jgi:hypothetical protein
MKFTKLSLIAVLAVSGAFAGEVNSDTTVAGKGQLYYYTTDNGGNGDLFDNQSTASSGAITLDVTHKVTNNISANFTAIGYSHLGDSLGENKMEGKHTGTYFNVANLTGILGDTTLIAGRQLLDTPMLGSFDWLLAPSGFEAYTIANKSIDKVTLIASYVNKLRGNNSGDNFVKLKDDNYAFGLAYSDAISANLWYYNIDQADYTEVYGDISGKVNNITFSVQGVSTDYDRGDDSTGYGAKISTKIDDTELSVAYNDISDRVAGMVEVDSIYTSSWNIFASQDIGSSWKVEGSKEFSGVSATMSYADYETVGNEFDLILGYKIADNKSLDAIFTNTKYGEDSDAENALEIIGTYTF